MAQAIRATTSSSERPLFDRRLIAGLLIFLGILIFFLTFTRLPSALDKFGIVDEPVTEGGRSAFSQVLDPTTFPFPLRWIAYGVNLWDANAIGMFFAMLLGAAAMTAFFFSPQTRVRALLNTTGAKGSGLGVAMGMPLFMCSACSAPVSLGFFRGGAALETSLGVILGSALFHPVALIAIFTLMPLKMALARIAFGVLLMLVVVPFVARMARRGGTCQIRQQAAVVDLPGLSPGTAGAMSWPGAFKEAMAAWGNNALDFALKLGPVMLVAGFVVGLVFNVLPPQQIGATIGTGLVAILVAAAIGTIIQVPGMFEIPLTLGLLALGVGIGPAAAILLTVPSTGLITFGVTRKEYGWKVPASLLVATFVLGTLAGITMEAL